MKWCIPAKTFLLGEYAALAEGSAILLTTTPHFELHVTPQKGLQGIHPLSPAGLWWERQADPAMGLQWQDPYQGLGGLGASSAQFLASYLACCQLHDKTPTRDAMLTAYHHTAWTGQGLRPSGYDVLAQSHQGCVYINRQKNSLRSFNWPFKTLSFIVVHTGSKLATHEHLLKTTLPQETAALSELVDTAKQAFETQQEYDLIHSINGYHEALLHLQLVAHHSLELINLLKVKPEILAIKGCGALGADTILIVTQKLHTYDLIQYLKTLHLKILATEDNLTSTEHLELDYFQENIKNNQQNT